MGLFGRILVVAACAGLCACSPFSSRPAQKSIATYTINETGKIARAEKPACGALSIDVLAPAPGYGSARMIYTRTPHQLESFAFHKWADTPSNMLQAVLLTALEKSNRFSSVMARSASGNLRLDAELVELDQQFAGSDSKLVLQVRFHLMADNDVIASKVFHEEEDAGKGPESGVEAANRAAAKLIGELIPWIDETLAKSKGVCQSTKD